MKARVKATGDIIDIAEYSTIYAENFDTCFYPNELEILDNSEDYWAKLEHQYAGMAMQGLMSNIKQLTPNMGHSYCDEIVGISVRIAHALVEKYKEKETKNDIQETHFNNL